MDKSRTKKKASSKEPEEEVHYHYHRGYGQSYSSTSVEKGPDGERKAVHHHYYYEPPRPHVERSNKPKIAGALIIMAAILGMIFGAAMLIGAALFSDMEGFISTFSETDTGDVYGVVILVDGTPVENVSVSIDGEDINTTTDADGKYTLYDVPMGNQKIRVEMEGYKTIVKKVFINPTGSDTNINMDPNADQSSDNEHDFELEPGTGIKNTGEYMPFEVFSAIMGICGVISLIFSVIAIVGGYYAVKRKNFVIAVVGGFFGILAVGFGLGIIMAVIALFILFLSREEFS